MTTIQDVIFWNVDTQYDFMRDDAEHKGALAIPGANEIEGNLQRLTCMAATYCVKVVNTADWHHKGSVELSDSPDFRTTFPPHCMMYTKGAQFVPASRPDAPYVVDWRDAEIDDWRVAATRNILLYKDKFDIFAGSPHAERVLGIIDPNTAVVYGVATNVCVDYAVKGLLERGIKVFVPLDAIKELPNLPLDEMIKSWEAKGAVMTTVDDIERMMKLQRK